MVLAIQSLIETPTKAWNESLRKLEVICITAMYSPRLPMTLFSTRTIACAMVWRTSCFCTFCDTAASASSLPTLQHCTHHTTVPTTQPHVLNHCMSHLSARAASPHVIHHHAHYTTARVTLQRDPHRCTSNRTTRGALRHVSRCSTRLFTARAMSLRAVHLLNTALPTQNCNTKHLPGRGES